MGVVQAVSLVITAVVAAGAAFLYCDGHDRSRAAVLKIGAAVGAVGLGVFFVGEATRTPESSVPRCDWSVSSGSLGGNCESSGEASRRAAMAAGSHFLSDYIISPTLEFLVAIGSALIGRGAAALTGRTPMDGRPMPLLVDDDTGARFRSDRRR